MPSLPKYPRILAIAPSSSGFGFAVIEGVNSLVDWDVKRIRKDLNDGCMEKIGKMVRFFAPDVIVMETGERRSARVRTLMKRIRVFAKKQGIEVCMLSREEARRPFFSEGLGSKDELAAILCERYPEELDSRLPPKRRAWMSEDHRMPLFTAVALGLAFRSKRKDGNA